MGKRHLTYWFIGIAVVVIAFFDAYVIIEGGPESSISHVLIELSYKYPVITFMMGFIMGHLFWRTLDNQRTRKIAEGVEGQKNDL